MAFTRRGIYTVLSGQITGTISDFVETIRLTHNDLKQIADGGYMANANAFDFRVFSNSDFTGALKIQLVSYDSATGTIILHVLVPSISVGNIIYFGFGDAALNTDSSDPTTWPATYLAVYGHDTGTNGTSAIAVDKTANGKNGTTTTATIQTGITSGAAGFNGSAGIVLPNSIYPATSTPSLTFQAWIKITSLDNAYNAVICTDETNLAIFSMFVKSTGKIAMYTRVHLASFLQVVSYDGTGANTLSVDTWYRVTMAFSTALGAPQGFNGYVNGALDAYAGPTSNEVVGLNGEVINIGFSSNPGGRAFNGLIDEVRLLDSFVTPEREEAEYNNQKPGAAFRSYSSEAVVTARHNGLMLLRRSRA